MDKYITFSQADATKLTLPNGKGVIVTNPPYGQRMMEQRQAQQLLPGLWPRGGRSEGLWRLYHFLRGGAGAVLRKALHQEAEAL